MAKRRATTNAGHGAPRAARVSRNSNSATKPTSVVGRGRSAAQAQRSLLEAIDAVVLLADRDGVLVDVSPQAERLLGRSAPQLRGLSLRALVGRADQPAFDSLWAAVAVPSPDAAPTASVAVPLSLLGGTGAAIPVHARLAATKPDPGQSPILVLTCHEPAAPVALPQPGPASRDPVEGHSDLGRAESKQIRRIDLSLSTVSMILIGVDGRGLCTCSAGAGFRILGAGAECVVGTPIFELVGKADGWESTIERALGGESAKALLPLAGALFDVTCCPAQDEQGKVDGFTIVAIDATDRLESERGRLLSQDRLQLLVRRAPLGIIIWDRDFRVASWNPAASQIFGYTESEAIGMHARRIVPDSIRPYIDRILENLSAQRGGERSRNENLTKDGRTILCEWYNTPLVDDHGEVVATASMAEDVTERTRAYEELIRRETELRLITDNLPAFIASVGPDGRYRFCNRWFESVVPSSGALTGKTLAEVFGPEVYATMRSKIEGALEGRAQQFQATYSDLEGRQRIAEVSYIPRMERGVPDGFYALGLDVTERRQAEARVNESESRFRYVAEAINNVIWITDTEPQQRIRYVNPAFEKVWGIKPEVIYANPLGWTDFIHDDDRSQVCTAFEHLVRGRSETYDIEYRIKRGDGQERWIHDRGFRIRGSPDGAGRIAGIAEDVTQRKNAERELALYRDHLESLVDQRGRELRASMDKLGRSERLASMGTLAAGLGHDMNNMLLPMRCVLDGIMADEQLASHRRGLLQLSESLEFLSHLATGLLHLASAPDEAAAGSVQTGLHEWWEQNERMLRATLPATANLTVSLEAGLPPIPVRPEQLSRAVLNLLVNGAEAGGSAAVLELVAERRERPAAGELIDRTLTWVALGVRDNGPGMSEGVRERAFDPFFTTKTRAMSTGLGLSLVRAVVAAAGGEIEVQSQAAGDAGSGTTIWLLFPGLEASQAPTTAQVPQIPKKVCVLLSDLRIKGYVSIVLQSRGFNVVDDGMFDEAEVLVADRDSASEAELYHFLWLGKHHRLVLSGPGFEDWSGPRTRRVQDAADVDELALAIADA